MDACCDMFPRIAASQMQPVGEELPRGSQPKTGGENMTTLPIDERASKKIIRRTGWRRNVRSSRAKANVKRTTQEPRSEMTERAKGRTSMLSMSEAGVPGVGEVGEERPITCARACVYARVKGEVCKRVLFCHPAVLLCTCVDK